MTKKNQENSLSFRKLAKCLTKLAFRNLLSFYRYIKIMGQQRISHEKIRHLDYKVLFYN